MPGPNPTSRISFGGVAPVLRVSNAAASRDYYVNALGFKENIEFADFFVSVSRGNCNLFLCQGDQGYPAAWVWIDGRDVDALYEEYKVSGARIRHPPTNYSWALEMQVEDLDGNVRRLRPSPRRAGRRVAGHVCPRWLNNKLLE
jgi:catechol 2,3-dioxygenase-like lactoylglutathione lyase family enzyme